MATLKADLVVCQRAASLMNPADKPGKDQATLEYMTLTHHLEWVRTAGDDQDILEEVIQSLEKSAVRGYHYWRFYGL